MSITPEYLARLIDGSAHADVGLEYGPAQDDGTPVTCRVLLRAECGAEVSMTWGEALNASLNGLDVLPPALCDGLSVASGAARAIEDKQASRHAFAIASTLLRHLRRPAHTIH